MKYARLKVIWECVKCRRRFPDSGKAMAHECVDGSFGWYP